MEFEIIKLFLTSTAISVICGIMGCFVVWKKMAYFGDSLSHSAILGIALGVSFNINHSISIIFVALLFSFLLIKMQTKTSLSADSLLGILAHSSLAVAMIIIAVSNKSEIDLESLLFGDISLISLSEIIFIYFILIIVIFTINRFWQQLILLTINNDMATARGINKTKLNAIFIILMTLTVASTIKILGSLLITSMLIIPAATARLISKTPHGMVITTILLSLFSSSLAILFSNKFNLPTGPSIIALCAINFVLIAILFKKFKHEN